MSRGKFKARKEKRRFLALPHIVIDCPEFAELSGNAVKLLIQLCFQYNGRNNGDFSAAFEPMKKRGWNSKTTLRKCLGELEEAGFIVKTREGRFLNPGGQCALYAITWQPIDEIPGKNLEVGPTSTPYRSFSPMLRDSPRPESGKGSVQKVDP